MSHVTDFDTLESLDGDEIFYVVKDHKDFQITLDQIKELCNEPPITIELGEFKW